VKVWLARHLSRLWHLIVVLTTAKDNETPSLSRLLVLVGAFEFFRHSAVAYTMHRQDFDPLAFAGALSALYVASAAAIRIALPANAGNDPQ
jgi:hypothetical protein